MLEMEINMDMDNDAANIVSSKEVNDLNPSELQKAIDYYIGIITKLSQQVEALESNLLACYVRERTCLSEK